MNRRSAILRMARGFKRRPTGWVHLPGYSSPLANTRYISGTGKGRICLLYKAFEHVVGPLKPHNQAIGDCVSHAFGLGVDILTTTQITAGSKERWMGKACTEVIYGGARVEIANGRLFGDGAMGAWAANWLRKYGVVLRKVYDKYDLRQYSGRRARKYGRDGCPNKLEPLAKLHPVRTTALVKSWEDMRDSVANGFPVAVCSSQGFNDERDSEGFLTPSGTWMHAMLIIGVDDTRRPGACIQNSWGSRWVSGPTRFRQPRGSFWADADVVDGMLSQGDSFALSNYIGYPRIKLPDYVLY